MHIQGEGAILISGVHGVKAGFLHAQWKQERIKGYKAISSLWIIF
jgi:hypothetical protein